MEPAIVWQQRGHSAAHAFPDVCPLIRNGAPSRKSWVRIETQPNGEPYGRVCWWCLERARHPDLLRVETLTLADIVELRRLIREGGGFEPIAMWQRALRAHRPGSIKKRRSAA